MMTSDLLARTAHLRGAEPRTFLGARGLEHLARNVSCLRRQALGLAGIAPARAAALLDGDSRDRQSPFAIAAGNTFEDRLVGTGAAGLLDLYRRAGVLAPAHCKIVVIPHLSPGLAQAETRRLLRQKLDGDEDAANIIIKPRLVVPYAGRYEVVELDYLVAADDEPFYTVGEIKSYSDQDGKTSPAKVRASCRQTAVGVIALRAAVERLGADDAEKIIPPLADLVLKWRGSMRPSLRRHERLPEVGVITAHLQRAEDVLADVEAVLPPGAVVDDPATLRGIPHHYNPSCQEYCALAAICQAEALAHGDPILLGERPRDVLAAAGTITRALLLLAGAEPRPGAEHTLARRLRDADYLLEEALHAG